MRAVIILSIIYLQISRVTADRDFKLFQHGNITSSPRIDVSKHNECRSYELSSPDDKLYITASSTEQDIDCSVIVSAQDGYSINFKFQSVQGQIRDDSEIKIFDILLNDRGPPQYSYNYYTSPLPTDNILMITSKIRIKFSASSYGFSEIGITVSSEEATYLGDTLGVMAISLGATLCFFILVIILLRCCGCIKPAVSREESRERIINRLRAAGYNVTRNYGTMDRGPVPYNRLANEDNQWGKMVFQPVVTNGGEVPTNSRLETPPPEYETLNNSRAEIHCSEHSAFTQVSPEVGGQPSTSGLQNSAMSPEQRRPLSDGSFAHSYHSAASQAYHTSPQSHMSPAQNGSVYPVPNPKLSEHSQNQTSAFINDFAGQVEVNNNPPPAFASVD